MKDAFLTKKCEEILKNFHIWRHSDVINAEVTHYGPALKHLYQRFNVRIPVMRPNEARCPSKITRVILLGGGLGRQLLARPIAQKRVCDDVEKSHSMFSLIFRLVV